MCEEGTGFSLPSSSLGAAGLNFKDTGCKWEWQMLGTEGGQHGDRHWALSLAVDESNAWLWVSLAVWSDVQGWRSGAGVLGRHLRVRAAVILPNVGRP